MTTVPKLAFYPTRLQHNDNPILSLRSPVSYLFFIFSWLCSHYDADLIKKMELRLMTVSVLLKIKFRHAQISVPKIGIRMSKTVCSTPGHDLYFKITLF